MATSFNLTIPQPCHEDWNQMTPQEQGRFCAACQKCVFDLRAKSQAEIRDLYVAQGGDLCGRINVSQLTPAPKPQRISLRRVLAHVHQGGWSQVRRFAFALLLAFGLSATGWAQTAATDTVRPVIDTDVIAGGITMEPTRIAYINPRPKRIALEGEVMDAEYNRLADIEVVLVTSNGKEHITRTEADGSYKFTVRTTEDFAIFAKRGEERTAWDADAQYTYDENTGGPLRWHALQFDSVEETPQAIAPTKYTISGTVLDADGNPASRVEVVLEAQEGELLAVRTDRKGRYTMTAETGQAVWVFPRRYLLDGVETGTIREVATLKNTAAGTTYHLAFLPDRGEVPLEDTYEADMLQPAHGDRSECKCLHERHEILDLNALHIDQPMTDTPTDTASTMRQTEPAASTDALPLDLQLYPNPSHRLVHVRANVTAPTLLKLRILSLEGQEVHSQDWQAQPGIDLSLPIHGLSAATYLIEIRDPAGRHTTQRLVVQ